MAKRIDIDIEREYYKQCDGTQIGIMDIPRLFKDCQVAIKAGTPLADAVKAAIEKYNVA